MLFSYGIGNVERLLWKMVFGKISILAFNWLTKVYEFSFKSLKCVRALRYTLGSLWHFRNDQLWRLISYCMHETIYVFHFVPCSCCPQNMKDVPVYVELLYYSAMYSHQFPSRCLSLDLAQNLSKVPTCTYADSPNQCLNPNWNNCSLHVERSSPPEYYTTVIQVKGSLYYCISIEFLKESNIFCSKATFHKFSRKEF